MEQQLLAVIQRCVDPADLAQALGMSREAGKKWIRKGGIPAHHWRSILHWLQEQENTCVSKLDELRQARAKIGTLTGE